MDSPWLHPLMFVDCSMKIPNRGQRRQKLRISMVTDVKGAPSLAKLLLRTTAERL
jgi:hypothetical protein